MKGIIAKVKRFMTPEEVMRVLLIVFFLLIFDVLVAVFGGSYLSANIGTFLGKSGSVILSDLLFLEGCVILAIGIFIAVARATQEMKTLFKSTIETGVDPEQTGKKRMNVGTLMVIIGAILIGLSITVGTLFL